MMLACSSCGTDIVPAGAGYACRACGAQYPVRDGILVFADPPQGTDLRIPERLLDLHMIREQRMYFDEYIQSDVEFYARLHFADFTTFHADLLLPYLAGSVIADLGCGHLSYINSFPDKGVAAYYGADLNEKALKVARRSFQRQFPLVLVKSGVINTPFKSGCADIVISSETLEHLDDPGAHIRELWRICRKGGYLSLSTPCASMYLYPYNLVTFLMDPRRFYKKLNSHRYWKEALAWHPGLRPAVLRQWVRDAGFSIISHRTRQWYYDTPVRPVYRIMSALEKCGFKGAGRLFRGYLSLTDALLRTGLPVLKWCGIRQFILCRKI